MLNISRNVSYLSNIISQFRLLHFLQLTLHLSRHLIQFMFHFQHVFYSKHYGMTTSYSIISVL